MTISAVFKKVILRAMILNLSFETRTDKIV